MGVPTTLASPMPVAAVVVAHPVSSRESQLELLGKQAADTGN